MDPCTTAIATSSTFRWPSRYLPKQSSPLFVCAGLYLAQEPAVGMSHTTLSSFLLQDQCVAYAWIWRDSLVSQSCRTVPELMPMQPVDL